MPISQLATPHGALCLVLGLLPVIVFLAALVFWDSYKLVRFKIILFLLGYGVFAALASLAINPRLQIALDLEFQTLARYCAPAVEEVMKSLIVVWAVRKKRIGFLVDAAICGFAIGAGFAVIENAHFFLVHGRPRVTIWIVRGFGTAVMHGGTTALFAIFAKHWSERRESEGPLVYLPGMIVAMAIHSFYNHFYLSPGHSALMILSLFPILFIAVFQSSERATQNWLGVGFDTDQELLQIINEGTISDTRIGRYLQNLKGRLEPTIVADMLCLIRLHLELSIQAKGFMIMKKAGFAPPTDPTTDEKFTEIRYLETSIGRTGLRALRPIFHTSSRDLWQMHMLRGN